MVVELSVVIVSVIFVKVIGFSIEFAGIFSTVGVFFAFRTGFDGRFREAWSGPRML